MKTKTTTLLLSLVFSFGFFVQQSGAASPPGVPTVPSYSNPAFSDITTPSSASGNDSQNGMNPSFIGATTPQEPDTFVTVDEDLDCVGNPIVDPKLHEIVITQKDALEKCAGEKIINIPQGYPIRINLKKTLVKAIVSQGEHEWDNPWSFQQDNNNLHPFAWGGIFAFYQGDDKSQFSCGGGGKPGWMEIPKELNDCQKINITYFFKACSLGQTTVTFNYESKPVPDHQPKTLTFRFNVVEAPTAPANGNEVDHSEK